MLYKAKLPLHAVQDSNDKLLVLNVLDQRLNTKLELLDFQQTKMH